MTGDGPHLRAVSENAPVEPGAPAPPDWTGGGASWADGVSWKLGPASGVPVRLRATIATSPSTSTATAPRHTPITAAGERRFGADTVWGRPSHGRSGCASGTGGGWTDPRGGTRPGGGCVTRQSRKVSVRTGGTRSAVQHIGGTGLPAPVRAHGVTTPGRPPRSGRVQPALRE